MPALFKKFLQADLHVFLIAPGWITSTSSPSSSDTEEEEAVSTSCADVARREGLRRSLLHKDSGKCASQEVVFSILVD